MHYLIILLCALVVGALLFKAVMYLDKKDQEALAKCPGCSCGVQCNHGEEK